MDFIIRKYLFDEALKYFFVNPFLGLKEEVACSANL